MTYHDQWRALSARIKGLVKAGEFHVACVSANSANKLNPALFDDCVDICENVGQYVESFNDSLPPSVHQAIRRFMEKGALKATSAIGRQSDSKAQMLGDALGALTAFESQITYLLSDTQHMRVLS